MIYLGILKHNINIFVNKKVKNKKNPNETIGYTLNVDDLLFDKLLKSSYIVMKKLAIARAFSKDGLDFKKNVRVITEREEQLLPILQKQSSTNVPLKSFYVHTRLYEKYTHLTLNQVVIESQIPNMNAKNIVIKSKIVVLRYFSDLICDNLWVTVNLKDYIIADVSCKKHNVDHNYQQQELLMDELDAINDKLVHDLQRVGLLFETLKQILTQQRNFIAP